jgi:formylglycine-generating enzyme required for sulfatase activity
LPTEAEWEKAASWDEEIQKKYEYPWDESIKIGCSLANYRDRNRFCEGDTGTVGRYTSGKSPYGVYDMAGNVWEWSSSLYQSYPYDPTDGRENLSASGSRVQRGGSWRDSGDILNSALRFSRDPRGSNDDLGFRCSRMHPHKGPP